MTKTTDSPKGITLTFQPEDYFWLINALRTASAMTMGMGIGTRTVRDRIEQKISEVQTQIPLARHQGNTESQYVWETLAVALRTCKKYKIFRKNHRWQNGETLVVEIDGVDFPITQTHEKRDDIFEDLEKTLKMIAPETARYEKAS